MSTIFKSRKQNSLKKYFNNSNIQMEYAKFYLFSISSYNFELYTKSHKQICKIKNYLALKSSYMYFNLFNYFAQNFTDFHE